VGQISSLMIDIQSDIIDGFLSFAQIAQKHNVSLNWVNSAWDFLCEQETEIEQTAAHNHLERDHDEPYEHDLGDSWYDDQYDIDVEN